MKQNLLFILAAFLCVPLSAQYKISGGNGQPLAAYKNNITEIYLLYGLEGAQIEFTSSQPGAHQWYTYKTSIDEKDPIPCEQDGNTSRITGMILGDCGYYVDAPNSPGYIWIVDYSLYLPRLSGLQVVEDEYRCEQLKLVADAVVSPIYYYIGGRRYTLPQNFRLTFNTLSWDEEQKTFLPAVDTLKITNLSAEITFYNPPLTNTAFTLTDAYAEHFGMKQSAVSEEYSAVRVEAHYSIERDREFSDNEKLTPGGEEESAPVGYTFTAHANEPIATYYIWTVSKQDDLTKNYDPVVRFTEPVLRYTFENAGNYEVRLEVDDARSVCADIQEVVQLTVDDTRLEIPNVFSPGSSPGVNDELKVYYRSVLSFRATVFNRWGNLLYRWTDPAKGWNGMVDGKLVPAGAYLVIVEYTDSGGKRRSKSQMVNILRKK
jgi:gliding motility-associated-like protein